MKILQSRESVKRSVAAIWSRSAGPQRWLSPPHPTVSLNDESLDRSPRRAPSSRLRTAAAQARAGRPDAPAQPPVPAGHDVACV